MKLVVEYRRYAEGCRKFAATLTNSNDKRALESQPSVKPISRAVTGMEGGHC